MQDTQWEIATAIIASISIFFILSLLFIVFVLISQKKKNQHKELLLSIEEKFKEQLLQSQLEVAEQTKVYIARELHDNISTLLSLVKMNLHLATDSKSAERMEELLSESKELVRTIISDVKQLSVNLNTDRIGELGMVKLLQLEVDRLLKLKLFEVRYQVEGEEWNLPADKQVILYRVCQELLHNILKHAQPDAVTVHLDFTPEKLTINISDNGLGFDRSIAPVKAGANGSGLINLRNRAKLIGALFFINSTPGNGTNCYIEVPFLQN